MKTAHIEKIIEKYLKKEKTQSAILVNGVWGSGKTFYLKSQLKEIIEKNSLKIMYISLNGISSIENLEHKLFLHFIPKLGKNQNDLVKSITNISTNIANATTGGVAGALQFASGMLQITANIAKAVNILGASSPDISSAQSNIPSNNPDNSPNFSQSGNSGQDRRIYVLETDISTAQKRVTDLSDVGIVQ